MTEPTYTLAQLGWSADFQSQMELEEIGTLTPARLAEVHRDRARALTETGTRTLTFPPGLSSGDVTVGDWVLYDPDTDRIARALDRKSLLHRRAAGTEVADQLIAANVDTLFITASLNADFNPARLERYLALAHGAGVTPVFVLTKADLCADPDPYLDTLGDIAPDTPAVALDARDTDAVARLADWVGRHGTAAFLGSSGVGKSTLIAALTGQDILTGGIREDDAKGRHTTTNRTLYPMREGGWVIDTPGMRALRLTDLGDGIDTVFADIAELATTCRFNDCAHETEPGCAVQAAIESGTLDPARLNRWRKLQAEDLRNTETIAEARRRFKSFDKKVRAIKKTKDRYKT